MSISKMEHQAALRSEDSTERHMAQDLAFMQAIEAMKETRQAELSATEAQILRDFEQFANK